MRTSSKTLMTMVVVTAAVLLAGCAPGPNPFAHQTSGAHAPAGFWLGLWHGFIVWVTFIVSLFDHRVSVYEVYNSGWPYNLGFVIGAACLHGGGAKASRRRRRRGHDAP
jgi:hypothetical protein